MSENIMRLKLKRKTYGKTFTEGKLFVNDGFECYTVEDVDRHLESGGVKIPNVTAIPKGTYNVTISMSTRFKKFMLEVQNVPGYSGVRIHAGNSSKDTEGCIILGSVNKSENDDWVSGSQVAVEALFKKVKEALSAGKKVTLEVC